MSNRYLMQELLGIQEEYKQLLEELCDEKDKDEFVYIIDEITLFWYSKRNVIELIMENISEKFDTYLFTGATYLDIGEGEHYPFVSLGKVHIVDDPLAKYAEAITLNLNDSFFKMMKKQIILAFDDDLRVLRECFGNIFLLPVTLLMKLEDGVVKHGSEKVLLSMFKEELSIKEVFGVKSLAELISMMKDGIQERVVFLEDEDRKEDIIVRFETYINEMNNPFGDMPASQKFLYSTLGFISQSLQILLCTAQYKIIPYIRYDVTFNYLMIIGENFLDVVHMQEIIFKMAFTHFFYKKFNWELINLAEFNKYCDVVGKIDIISQLEKQMKNAYKLNTSTIKDMNYIIDDFLAGIPTVLTS
ncbi:hypothetical protein BN3590_04591 [Clostridium sp. C105KSO15]|nr:hypothetical protein BN3590_04591 [Clostridium sp. C105KSO15]